MSANFTPALRSGIATEKLGRNGRGFVTYRNRRPQSGPDGEGGLRVEREFTLLPTLEADNPYIFQGNSITLLFDKEGLRAMDQATGNFFEVPLFDMAGDPATIRPGTSWQVADLYENVYATNGETLVFYYKNLWRAVPWTSDGTTAIGPRINSVAPHKEGRVFFGGIEHPYSIVDWPTIFKARIAAGDDMAETLQGKVASDGYGVNWVGWTSIGGGDAIRFHDEQMMIDGGGTYFTESNPFWRWLWSKNTAGARPMPWQGAIHNMIELGEHQMVYGANGMVALRPSHVVAMQPLRGFSKTVGIANRDAVAGDMSGHIFVDTFGTAWGVSPNLAVERLGLRDKLKPMIDQGFLRVLFDEGEREFWFVGQDRTYILNSSGIRESWVKAVSMAVVNNDQRAIVATVDNPPEATAGGRIFVDQEATGDNDGSEWFHAFTTIQDGLDAAGIGDEVWVKQGNYNERIELPEGVILLGGFVGHELDPAERSSITTIDGTGGVAPYSTVLITQPGCTMDGFVIQGGNATNGGGVNVGAGSFKLSRCAVVGNTASGNGGGVYVSEDCTIENCLIISNEATQDGGGIAVVGAAAGVFHCTIAGNTAGDDGSSVFGPASVANCILVYEAGNTNVMGTTGIVYSCVSPGGAVGTGNFPGPPDFIEGDLPRPAWSSPCRNTGLAMYKPDTDILRSPRGDVVDVGCFRYMDERTARLETNWFTEAAVANLPELKAILLSGERVSSWRGQVRFMRRDRDDTPPQPVQFLIDGVGEGWPRATGLAFQIVLETDDESAELDVFDTLMNDDGNRSLEPWLQA